MKNYLEVFRPFRTPANPHKHWYFKASTPSRSSSRTELFDKRNKALAQHTAESLKLLINKGFQGIHFPEKTSSDTILHHFTILWMAF